MKDGEIVNPTEVILLLFNENQLSDFCRYIIWPTSKRVIFIFYLREYGDF